jgi:Cu/Ag efflux protein CusF
MRTLIGSIGFAVLAVLAALALPAAAQTGAAVVTKGPGVAGVAQTVKRTMTITAIDAATRLVTLKGRGGRETTLTAGPEVKNFAQLKVGDKVKVEYVEALTLELKKGSTTLVARTEQAGAAGAKPGERPAGMVGRQVTVTAEVVDLNPKTQVVTLRGPERTVRLKVADPEQFKRITKGDRVEAIYTEALAIVVEPAKN